MQIIFCSCVNDTTLFKFPFLRSLRLDYQIKDRTRETAEIEPSDRSFVKKMAERFPEIFIENKLGDRMIKQLLNSVIAKYRYLSVSRRSIIICLSVRLGQMIDLLATDISR